MTSRGIPARAEEKRTAKGKRRDVKERIFAICSGKAGELLEDNSRIFVSLICLIGKSWR